MNLIGNGFNKRFLRLLLVLLFFNSIVHQLYSNDKIKLSKSDISKLKMTEKVEEKANKKDNKANYYFSLIKTNNIQEGSKKYKNLLLKANKYKGQSLILKLKSQRIKYEIYATKAYQFWTHFLGQPDEASYASHIESEARKQFQQYLLSYNDAISVKELNQQNNLLLESLLHLNDALSKIIKAYEIYSEISFYSDETTRQQNLIKNKQLAEKDSIMSIKEAQNIAEIPTKNDIIIQPNIPEPGETYKEEDSLINQDNNFDLKNPNEPYDNQNTEAQFSDNLSFKFYIQIAACRVPLNKEELLKIYSNPSIHIIEIYENEWYKYLIGPFDSYNEAMINKTNLNIKGSFIKKYKQLQNIKII